MLVTPGESFRPPYIAQWERDLSISFTDHQMDRMLFFAYKTSICSRYQEIGYKCLTRWHHTPAKLHKMYPACSPTCWRCGGEIGSYLHIFWSCPTLQSFWTSVLRITQKFTDHTLLPDPALFLLHHHDFPRASYRKSILPLLFTAAKSCIPLLWKQTQPPTVAMWLRKVAHLNEMEDLISTERGTRDKFMKRWFYWHEFTFTTEYRDLVA